MKKSEAAAAGRPEKKKRAKFYVEKNSAFVKAVWIFMLLSAVFRILGCWGLWKDSFFAVTQIALPLAANLFFILFIVLLGTKALWLTSLPVLMGVAFFIIKAFTFDSWIHTTLCIALYILVAVLYVLTVFGSIRTKWLLVPLFGLPFLYHVFVEDLAALRDAAHPVTFSAGLQELSVLCIMLALLMTALAMKKKKPKLEDAELPKIKDPVVIMPAEEHSTALPANESSAEAKINQETVIDNTAADAAQNTDNGSIS